MRVWALASCGSLLALAACSADQATPPQADLSSSMEDDPAQMSARPEAMVPPAASSPRPEAPVSRSLTPRAVGLRGRTILPKSQAMTPSAEALRARVQQIRAQRARVGNAPLAARPLPTPASPVVRGLPIVTAPPSQVTPTATPAAPEPAPRVNTAPGVGAAIAPATPSLQSPGVAGVPPRGDLHGAESITGAALQPTTPATLARHLPINPVGHQGYSARLGSAPSLTPRVPPALGQAVPGAAAATARAGGHQHQAVATAREPLFPLAEAPTTPPVAPAAIAPTSPANESLPSLSDTSAHRSSSPTNLTLFPVAPREAPASTAPVPQFSHRQGHLVTHHRPGEGGAIRPSLRPQLSEPDRSAPDASGVADSLPLDAVSAGPTLPRVQASAPSPPNQAPTPEASTQAEVTPQPVRAPLAPPEGPTPIPHLTPPENPTLQSRVEAILHSQRFAPPTASPTTPTPPFASAPVAPRVDLALEHCSDPSLNSQWGHDPTGIKSLQKLTPAEKAPHLRGQTAAIAAPSCPPLPTPLPDMEAEAPNPIP